MTNRTKYLNEVMREYILDHIDDSGYDDYSGVENKTPAEKLAFLYETFKSEYGWSIERYGLQRAFREWLQGLPTAFTIDFENYKIIELAIAWGSLPKDYIESQADRILNNWFNFVTVHTFKAFKKYKVVQ